MSVVKIQHKGQMTIPISVRSAVGVVDGDLVDVTAVGRKIVITPRLIVDRSKFPSANDEYTPEQRRLIKAQIKQAEKGPWHGPFGSGAGVAAFLKKTVKSQRSSKALKARQSPR